MAGWVTRVKTVKRVLHAVGLGSLSRSSGPDAVWTKLLAALATVPPRRTSGARQHAL